MAEKSFSKYIKRLEGSDKAELRYYDLLAFARDRLDRLPFCLRIFLESCMRNCDDVEIGCEHVEALLDSSKKAEIRFKPARTLFRDLTAHGTGSSSTEYWRFWVWV
ncbi:uncharacterized protein [Oscarella lobularis]|uniref:uncharacterized protein n=1 Tax=Oscarella lobularis TaxID=121494 RepID=UPI0033143BD7